MTAENVGFGTRRSMLAGLIVSASLCLSSHAQSEGGRLTVLSSLGLKSVIDALGPQYTASTGVKLDASFDTSVVIKAAVESGRPFDLVIVTPPLIADLIKQGKVVDGSSTTLARTGVGIAVKRGEPKPDIATLDALKATLLNAGSIAFSASGFSTGVFSKATDRLGITAVVKAKAKPVPEGATAALVASGETELAVQLIPELLSVEGADLVGPLPEEVQSFIVLAAGISTAGEARELAQAFIDYLRTPAARAVMEQKGLTPD